MLWYSWTKSYCVGSELDWQIWHWQHNPDEFLDLTCLFIPFTELLRVRQEAMAAVRNAGGMEAHVPSAGSSSSQRRKQGLPQHRDAQFPER